jgi:hypothetical protein
MEPTAAITQITAKNKYAAVMEKAPAIFPQIIGKTVIPSA